MLTRLFTLASAILLATGGLWAYRTLGSIKLTPDGAILPENFVLHLGFAIGIIALVIIFGFWYFSKRKSYQKMMKNITKLRGTQSEAHGSADFAKKADLKAADLTGSSGFLLGKFNEQFLRFNKPGHIITFAPTRSGKGVGHVIPNLLSHPGSVVVNDIKGENYAVTSRHRSQFTKVFSFAPFQDDSDCYNPIDFIRVGTDTELDDAALIADMIILEEGSDPFWSREAKNLVTGLILYVANESPPALRTLSEVRFLLMQSKADFDQTVKAMGESKNAYVRRVAASLAATEAKVMASVLSTAKSQTAVWDSPKLSRITARSDFQLEDLKKELISLYIIIPPEYLNVYKPVIRLMVGLATVAATRVQGKPQFPILFLIDEFPALGYMQPIEAGIGYLAGYGVVLWMFIQDLSQLKDLYERWATFLSNCAVRMAFGTNDIETAKVLSDMLGTTTIQAESESKQKAGFLQSSKGGVNVNTSSTSRALMTPDEVMRMPNDTELIFVQGSKPIIAEKIRYFADPAFKGLFDRWNG